MSNPTRVGNVARRKHGSGCYHRAIHIPAPWYPNPSIVTISNLRSRVAALILLVSAVIGAGVTFANKAGADLGGGNNIFLALIVLWAGIRAVEATFKLHGRFAVDLEPQVNEP